MYKNSINCFKSCLTIYTGTLLYLVSKNLFALLNTNYKPPMYYRQHYM